MHHPFIPLPVPLSSVIHASLRRPLEIAFAQWRSDWWAQDLLWGHLAPWDFCVGQRAAPEQFMGFASRMEP